MREADRKQIDYYLEEHLQESGDSGSCSEYARDSIVPKISHLIPAKEAQDMAAAKMVDARWKGMTTHNAAVKSGEGDIQQYSLLGMAAFKVIRYADDTMPGGYSTVLLEYARITQYGWFLDNLKGKHTEAGIQVDKTAAIYAEMCKRSNGDLSMRCIDVMDVESIQAA